MRSVCALNIFSIIRGKEGKREQRTEKSICINDRKREREREKETLNANAKILARVVANAFLDLTELFGESETGSTRYGFGKYLLRISFEDALAMSNGIYIHINI